MDSKAAFTLTAVESFLCSSESWHQTLPLEALSLVAPIDRRHLSGLGLGIIKPFLGQLTLLFYSKTIQHCLHLCWEAILFQVSPPASLAQGKKGEKERGSITHRSPPSLVTG